ncbi:hypothetical protein BN1708_006692 [Verticillium longisporum]|uniref:Uncharacterized protein n=1 Tax=Verticillium longisporum TaxID=100787 RepID=A0A0G4MMD4_VERLO|nr:hypothetical protein BN1708_006692 [Verticillium longisporum]
MLGEKPNGVSKLIREDLFKATCRLVR